MNNRVNYKKMKNRFLNNVFFYCKIKFRGNKIDKWHSLESGLGFALEQIENCYNSPIESLMKYVIYIILNSGRNTYSHDIVIKDIDKILSQYNIGELTENLDKEEKEEFLHDLNLVLENRELESLKNSFEYKW